MKFFRFTNADNNYTLLNFGDFGVHQWNLPLTIKNSSVALSSMHLHRQKNSRQDNFPDIVTVKCNLLERSMVNQSGILKKITLRKMLRSNPAYIFEASYPGCLF